MKQSLFVAVGHNGLRMVSLDGVTWNHIQSGKEGETYRAVVFGLGRFVAVGSYGGGNILATTTNGAKWELGTKDGKYVKFYRGLSFGNEFFLAIGGDPGSVGSSSPFISTSTDGLKWGEFEPIVGKNILRRVAYGNKRFVGVGDRGRRSTSLDGREWKDAPDVKAIDTLVDVAFGNNVFVGVGLHGLRMTSKDGLVWTDRQLGEEGEHLNSVIWAKDRFVAIGAGATYFSPDGVQWTREKNQAAPTTATFGNGLFIGSSWKGQILTSKDAITWKATFKSENHVESIAFGEIGS